MSVIDAVGGPLLVSGQGLRIANSSMETIKIHQENQAKLQAMSQSEILEEQRKLLGQLGELNVIRNVAKNTVCLKCKILYCNRCLPKCFYKVKFTLCYSEDLGTQI